MNSVSSEIRVSIMIVFKLSCLVAVGFGFCYGFNHFQFTSLIIEDITISWTILMVCSIMVGNDCLLGFYSTKHACVLHELFFKEWSVFRLM